ncbi:MAG: ABC transporter permease [Prolixibacteraceae bacterium]|jgi:putative ABC transport system permease protein|nr:ABC transporter permease [Prolixibacteraceae bacterium]
MLLKPLVVENIHIAFQSIRSNLLRSVLTILIIAVGISALVGILTAIDSIKNAITADFTRLGANTFSIQSRGMRIQIGNQRYRSKNYSYISYFQARDFREQFHFPAVVSISTMATNTATVKYESKKSNPNVIVRGIDENYLSTDGYDIENGRNISMQEAFDGTNVALIGAEMVPKMFPKGVDPIGKLLTIGSGKYVVVGTLKSKGSGFGETGDRLVFLPFANVRQYFARPKMNFRISVHPYSAQMMDAATGEAEGVFRNIRKLNILDDSDFIVEKSDNLVNILLDNIKYVTMAATIIGVITLLGAAIGLMNILLVTVAERTREIGIRKAIGANSGTIRHQFLIESIVIGQMGGALGILLGIMAGNLISLLMGTAFIIPWNWMIGGVTVCLLVSFASGVIPAVKAAKLDPIEALRYE